MNKLKWVPALTEVAENTYRLQRTFGGRQISAMEGSSSMSVGQ